jgi:hypothetical protein
VTPDRTKIAPLSQVPAGTTTVSPGLAASIALWMAPVFMVTPSPLAPKAATPRSAQDALPAASAINCASTSARIECTCFIGSSLPSV